MGRIFVYIIIRDEKLKIFTRNIGQVNFLIFLDRIMSFQVFYLTKKKEKKEKRIRNLISWELKRRHIFNIFHFWMFLSRLTRQAFLAIKNHDATRSIISASTSHMWLRAIWHDNYSVAIAREKQEKDRESALSYIQSLDQVLLFSPDYYSQLPRIDLLDDALLFQEVILN